MAIPSTTESKYTDSKDRPSGRYARFLLWRNRMLRSKTFQKWAARLPIAQSIARTRATDLHHILAGFVYSQTLSAAYKLGILECLKDRIATLDEIARACELEPEAALTLIKAATAIDLLQEVDARTWTLGELGASIHGNPGVQSMLRHHDLLYRDMADPAHLLRAREGAALRGYWPYVDGDHNDPVAAARYSELMADSQHLIANHILDAIKLKPGQRLLDIGGGTGTFARLASERFPEASTAVFDLPQVIAAISPRHRGAMEVVSGDMFEDPIPKTFDTISLVRILHDHDDAPVDRLLNRCFDALPNGGELIIAEPMAGTRNAEPIGHTYFGFYLWAMGSG
ncbi:MAG: methyltransferase, partial [Pseudomonadota bacterium]|nr:methyltransferase [Pseudomonadota bacterium]